MSVLFIFSLIGDEKWPSDVSVQATEAKENFNFEYEPEIQIEGKALEINFILQSPKIPGIK